MAKKKKVTRNKSKVGSQAHQMFSKPKIPIKDVFNSDSIEEEKEEPSQAEEATARGRGRPPEIPKDQKMKTTITFERSQLVWLSQICNEVLSKTGKVIDRGDIIRGCIEALQESGIDFSEIQSNDEIKDRILSKLKS